LAVSRRAGWSSRSATAHVGAEFTIFSGLLIPAEIFLGAAG
jgi:hypothetical protein